MSNKHFSTSCESKFWNGYFISPLYCSDCHTFAIYWRDHFHFDAKRLKLKEMGFSSDWQLPISQREVPPKVFLCQIDLSDGPGSGKKGLNWIEMMMLLNDANAFVLASFGKIPWTKFLPLMIKNFGTETTRSRDIRSSNKVYEMEHLSLLHPFIAS